MSVPSQPPSSPVDGRSPTDGYSNGSETGSDGTGDHSATQAAIEELARLLEPEAFDPDLNFADGVRARYQNRAHVYAIKAIVAGYRRTPDQAALDEAYALGEAAAERRLLAADCGHPEHVSQSESLSPDEFGGGGVS